MMELFLGTFSRQFNPLRTYNLQDSSLPSGQGILTLFPSTTAFALALGADNSARINLAQKPLDFRRRSFSSFIVTYVSIRTSDTSRILHRYPFTNLQNLPLPVIIFEKIINPNSVYDFSPVTSSAQKL